MRKSSFLLFITLFTAAPLTAQVIRGSVVEQDTGGLVTGGFVVLLDEGGVQRDAALTDAAGRFLLTAPEPGHYRLGLDRIGYLSVTTPSFQVAAGQTIEYRLAALVEPVDLAGIDVRIEPECRVRPEEATRAALVWEEVRKALTATAWSQRRGLLRYTIVGRERTLDPYNLEVRQESSRTRRGMSRGSPYVARDADLLSREGYARMEGTVQVYYAPDATTLLSNSFLDRHCFRLRPADEGRSGLVGLDFEPVAEEGSPDIEGTIWIDEETAALETIEFGYTGLPTAIREVAEGTIEFERLPTGEWIVRRWKIRMPVIREPSENVYSHLTMDPSRRTAAVIAIEEDSGEVEQVVPLPRSEPLRAAARRLPSEPLTLAGADRGTGVGIRIGDTGDACPAVGTAGAAVVRGAVRDSASGVALPGAGVTFSWQGVRPGEAVARTDGSGRYTACGVPVGLPVHVLALFPQRSGELVLTFGEGTRNAELDLDVSGPDPVEGARIESEVAVRPIGASGTDILGVVRDGVTGEALAGAQVALPELGRGAVSEPDGAFRIEAVPPGPRALTVEFLGYATGNASIDTGNGSVRVAARLVPSPIVMAALDLRVPVREDRESRARGESRYVLTAAEIPPNTTLHVGQLLARRMPGLRHEVRGGCSVLRTRYGEIRLVVLDGQRIYDTCVLHLVRPEDVERIELLPGTSAAVVYGPEASGGVLVVTTKRGGGS
ncbi:MAG TPA: carboxypeptidase regulatory-like domain-containing protein [Gemmatimonadota bacterium]|nr:carboxypeptidase regulatory-like domain-containing protein [Gemmatimonadota bacterium]